MRFKDFLSKRINLILFVTAIFIVLAAILTFILPNYLFNTRLREVEDNLAYIARNYEDIDEVMGTENLYIYIDGESSTLTNIGYVDNIDPGIEVHLIHWSHDQQTNEFFYTDDFKDEDFVYFIKIIRDEHYIISFADTAEIHDFVDNFSIYSTIFVVILYLLTIIITSTYFGSRLIKQYSLYDSITGLSNKTAFFHYFDKKDLSNYHISYHNIFNLQDIIDAIGTRFYDVTIKMLSERLLNVYDFKCIYQLSDNEYIIVTHEDNHLHQDFYQVVNTKLKVEKVEPYEFKIKTVYVDKALLSNVDAKTLINRLQYAYSFIKNQIEDTNVVDNKLLDQMNEEIYYQSKLQEAINQDEIDLFLQIKVDPKTNKAIGAEGLSRWIKDGKVISPGKYIHIAETSGQIYDIDLVGFNKACEIVSKLKDKDLLKDDFAISVNFSPITLKNLQIQTLKDIILENGVDTSHLSIEITESVTLEIDRISTLLDQIAELGITIEIDDFSAGNSSFAVLPFINASCVKLDMAILPKDFSNNKEVLVYDSLITISKKLNLDIISEGVELVEQVEYLKEKDIKGIQGYYYSKPVEMNEFIDILKKHS